MSTSSAAAGTVRSAADGVVGGQYSTTGDVAADVWRPGPGVDGDGAVIK